MLEHVERFTAVVVTIVDVDWADVLRAQSTGVGNDLAAHSYLNYIRESLQANKPYDQFVRELVTSEGDCMDTGAVGYYVRDRGMVLRLAQVPGIVGIKEATGNIERACQLIKHAPAGFSIYSGDDGTAVALMPALRGERADALEQLARDPLGHHAVGRGVGHAVAFEHPRQQARHHRHAPRHQRQRVRPLHPHGRPGHGPGP